MVLSDLDNDPGLIVSAAGALAVLPRVAHITRLGLQGGDYPEFWTRLRHSLPDLSTSEVEFLPGLSRLSSETGRSGPNQRAMRIWLRTAFRR